MPRSSSSCAASSIAPLGEEVLAILRQDLPPVQPDDWEPEDVPELVEQAEALEAARAETPTPAAPHPHHLARHGQHAYGSAGPPMPGPGIATAHS